MAMHLFSPRARLPGVEPRSRGTYIHALPLLHNGWITVVAMLLAVTFATLVGG
jgi:hypothetical protein